MRPVRCGVNGCSTRLRPMWKIDPQDRSSWIYEECDVCFRPVCDQHSHEVDGRLICDRCLPQRPAVPVDLIPLGIRRHSASA